MQNMLFSVDDAINALNSTLLDDYEEVTPLPFATPNPSWLDSFSELREAPLLMVLDPFFFVPEDTSSIVSAATSPIVPEATSPIVPEATSPIVPEATSPIVPAATSSIVPEATSPIVPAAISSIVSAATSHIVPEATSSIVPVATSPIVPAAISSIVSAATFHIVSAATSPIVPVATSPIVPVATSSIVSAATSPIVPEATSSIVPAATSPIVSAATSPIVPEAPVVKEVFRKQVYWGLCLNENNEEQLDLFLCLENCKWNGDATQNISIVWFWSNTTKMFKKNLNDHEVCLDERKSSICFDLIEPFNVYMKLIIPKFKPVLLNPVQRFPIINGIEYPVLDNYECPYKLRKYSDIMFPLDAMEFDVQFVENKGFKRQKQ
jgi:hypothetical protein